MDVPFPDQLQAHLENGNWSAAIHCVYRQWTSTQQLPETDADAHFLAHAQSLPIDIAGTPVISYHWGSGPKILTMHGWSGATSQYKTIIEALYQRNFQCIAFDAPAHGRSPGTHTTAAQITNTLQVLDQKFGPFYAVIGHSFGTACLSLAIRNGLRCERAILISATAQFRDLVQAFTQYYHLSEPLVSDFYQYMEQQHGVDVWQKFSTDSNAQTISIPALIIHDRLDRITPVQLGKQVASAWPAAQWMQTEGLGHRRILDSPLVIERILEFLA